MPTITFLPSGSSADVENGTSLLDAAARCGVTIHAPCGGEGACGECRVQVTTGTVESVSRGCLPPNDSDRGWVLACGSRVAVDATILVPEVVDEGARIVTGTGDKEGLRGPATARVLEPLAIKYFLEVAPPSLENSFSDLERLERAIVDVGGPEKVTAGLPILQRLAATLRDGGHRVTATIVRSAPDAPGELIRIETGDTTDRSYGLAIDIGTTTCALHLVNLLNNRVLGTEMDYNAQISRGHDIISRINYAQSPESLEELRSLVVENLNAPIGKLCDAHQVGVEEIDSAVVAGNTTMIHLFLGLEPEHIRLAPYTPTVTQPPVLGARQVGLAMNPEGAVAVAPGVGSYVGGDITAGLLMTPLADDWSEEVRLFLDIGTNGEVVVGNSDWLMACAASAGPAFEGSGTSCGMRAASGAVERVRVDPATGRAETVTIGGGKPRGICGSGTIDLLAELWTNGLLEPSGNLNPSRCGDSVRPSPDSSRNLVYTVVPAEETATGKAITIDERDIQNLLRTKAAVYSAVSLMLKSVGLDIDSIERVYVAGGFGRFLDLEKSIAIGLLPDLPTDRFTYLGNSALAGAREMLVSARVRGQVRELADRMTYLDLNADPAYMDEYTAALFLPHTDINRFPTVRAMLASRSLERRRS
jgi:uncharacterized 2Fe-2S/4Fe-4S cluster protein (DUF4445 family)